MPIINFRKNKNLSVEEDVEIRGNLPGASWDRGITLQLRDGIYQTRVDVPLGTIGEYKYYSDKRGWLDNDKLNNDNYLLFLTDCISDTKNKAEAFVSKSNLSVGDILLFNLPNEDVRKWGFISSISKDHVTFVGPYDKEDIIYYSIWRNDASCGLLYNQPKGGIISGKISADYSTRRFSIGTLTLCNGYNDDRALLFKASNINDHYKRVLSERKNVQSPQQNVQQTQQTQQNVQQTQQTQQNVQQNIFNDLQIKISAEEMSRASGGLNYRDIYNLLLKTKSKNIPLDLDLIWNEKIGIIKNEHSDLFELVRPAYGFNGIGGMDNLKKELSFVVSAMKTGDVLLVPDGISFYGPPGTGKSALAEALAYECGFAFIKFRSLRNMYVGASERNYERAFQVIRATAPAIIYRDEVDEEDSGRDSYQGDSGVSSRIRQMWMEFLADPNIQGKILVISCSNRPDRIDPALKRSGRSSWRIPLCLPDKTTREQIFRVMFGEHRFNIPNNITDFSNFAEMTDGISGADIMAIVKESYSFAFRNGRKSVMVEDLTMAISDFNPSDEHANISRMTDMAISSASHNRFKKLV